MEDTIKLSEIDNFSNHTITKSGDRSSLERILYKIKDGGKGKFPTYYYKEKKIIIDLKREDIDEVSYCDRCMIYIKNNDDENCPKCGNSWSYCRGYKVKNKKMYLYADGDVSENFIKKYGNELVEYNNRLGT